ncbi:MAG TPA: asparagine synthase (glutamine-hydrolyzing) [Phycisphaerae bacterium]|nr:asparagine synthase (glutamine-hydrolyzing) [Phycisphaerae bacterium]HSA26069.1 asparagine synthase (glutamine-hydrolyzing) [Phycisphaerae bacterium]
MCGIAGMVHFGGLPPERHDAGARMAGTLRHRGPDDRGLFCDGFVSLGHSRLSIIDLENGRQPLPNEDGTVWVVFNGEIYNYRPLSDMLQSRGHEFKTRCDTEVLVHLYEDFGESFVEHLHGMFAIALWDTRQQKMVLARDRLGIKPLYWSADGERVAFGSELKAVLADGDVPRDIDPAAMIDFLAFGHVPAPRTVFKGIRKLEPGHMAVCRASGVALRRWWDIPFGEEPPEPTTGEESRRWTDQFADLLEDAVRMRLVADVPVGAFLSGGVDSASVTATMCRQAGGAVLTHTVGFHEEDHDERAWARQVAEALGTDHREVMVRPDAAWAAETLVRHFDEPFADPSAVATLYLSRIARERVKVALAGDGGDELLAGYRRYRFDMAESALRARAPAWLRRSAAGWAGWLYPQVDWLPRPLRARRTLQNLAGDNATAHLRSAALMGGVLPELILRPEIRGLANNHDPFLRGRELFHRCPAKQLLNRFLYVDLKTFMADEILTKVDRTSMAVGLEVRAPLLDHRLVELAARLPISLKLAGGRGKVILRDTCSRWLGNAVADRPKHGFDVPTDKWFRGPLRAMAHDLLTGLDSRSREWLEAKAVSRLLRNHDRGIRANGRALWAILNLELWARAYTREEAKVEA